MKKYNFGNCIVYSLIDLDEEQFNKWIKDRCCLIELEDKTLGIIKENDNVYYVTASNDFKDYIQELTENAIYDSLTGAFNKKEILEALKRHFESFVRYDTPFSVLLFDIDFFKKVNDTYGHLAGDYILKEFVKIINSIIRKSDILGRFGGEEFILVLPNTKMCGAMKFANRLKEEIESFTFKFNNEEIKITTSIGVTSASKKDDVKSLLARVDEALYEAKRKGRNRIEYR
jgi:diguanylate cyclase (GGDEF)-like protein